jgi:hypothetical protein
MAQRLEAAMCSYEDALDKQLEALTGELFALKTIAGGMWAAIEEEDEVTLTTLIPQSLELVQRSAKVVQLIAQASTLDAVCDDLDEVPEASNV